MPVWGSIELEDEVEAWLLSLSPREFGQASFYLDLLESEGIHLGYPYSSQLDGRLRELRFFVGSRRYRLTYYVTAGRRIIMLTVFRKSAGKHPGEVRRARAAMLRCMAEDHTAEGES